MAIVYPIGGSGNLTGSDDCTATKAEVLKGFYAITKDSDDEAIQGTLELTGNAEDRYVYNGKTYYSNDAKVKHTGTLRVDSVVNFNKPSVSGATVTFTWQNPKATPYGGVIIRVKESGYPTSVTDGIEAYRGTGNNKEHGAISSASWIVPKNNVTYYARIWMYCNTSVGMLYSSYKEQTFVIPLIQGRKVFTNSGVFTVPNGVDKIQVFMVGGGGGGASRIGSYGSGGGGGGGYTKTFTTNVTSNQKLNITVGAGGGRDANGGTSSVAGIGSVNGGNGAYSNGGNGGSGGGESATSSSRYYGGAGGSDGANGGGVNGGKGQGTTTREFGTSGATLYAGGGGGGNRIGYDPAGKGGAGGGGNGGSQNAKDNFPTFNHPPTSGTANTGGGGGGASGTQLNYGLTHYGGNGGSGIVIIRWGY